MNRYWLKEQRILKNMTQQRGFLITRFSYFNLERRREIYEYSKAWGNTSQI